MLKYPWTEDEDRALAAAWTAGVSMEPLAQRMNLSRRTLYNRAGELGLGPRKWRTDRKKLHTRLPKLPSVAHPLVKVLYALMIRHAVSIPAVADKSGVAAETIRSWNGRCEPGLSTLIACLNALGFELVVRPEGQLLEPSLNAMK